jgi:hypothetical protein
LRRVSTNGGSGTGGYGRRLGFCLGFLGDSLETRALPPLGPPRRPSPTDPLSLASVANLTISRVSVANVTKIEARALGSLRVRFLLDRRGMLTVSHTGAPTTSLVKPQSCSPKSVISYRARKARPQLAQYPSRSQAFSRRNRRQNLRSCTAAVHPALPSLAENQSYYEGGKIPSDLLNYCRISSQSSPLPDRSAVSMKRSPFLCGEF